MKPPNHMNFGYPELKRLTSGLNDLWDGEFEGVRVAFPGTKGAELARKNANIGIVDVTIQDISRAIPVFPLPNDIGDQTKCINVRRAIKPRRFVLGDSFARQDLVTDRAQFLRNEADARETFHRLNLTQDESRIKLAANFRIFQSNIWSCTVL
jgi:hypothetical protein